MSRLTQLFWSPSDRLHLFYRSSISPPSSYHPSNNRHFWCVITGHGRTPLTACPDSAAVLHGWREHTNGRHQNAFLSLTRRNVPNLPTLVYVNSGLRGHAFLFSTFPSCTHVMAPPLSLRYLREPRILGTIIASIVGICILGSLFHLGTPIKTSTITSKFKLPGSDYASSSFLPKGPARPPPKPANETLDFQEIIYLSMPYRTDRQDQLSLIAAVTGLKLTMIPGVRCLTAWDN